jgi:hypothetical protein
VGRVTPPAGRPLLHGPRVIAYSMDCIWFCATQPPCPMLMGRAEVGPLASFCFSKFPDFFQIIVEFKNLHKIYLTAENYETNFIR